MRACLQQLFRNKLSSCFKDSFSEGLAFLAHLGITTTLSIESGSAGSGMVEFAVEVGIEIDVAEFR